MEFRTKMTKLVMTLGNVFRMEIGEACLYEAIEDLQVILQILRL